MINWIKSILLLCFIGALIRFIFFIEVAPSDLNFAHNSIEIFNAFSRGFRFDLSAISYLTILFIPFFIYKKTPTWVFQLGVQLYRLLIYFWISISVCDIVFYTFFADRLNLIAFGLLDDNTTALAKTFWKNYPVGKITGLILALCFLAYYITKKFLQKNREDILSMPYKFKLLLLILFVVFARGTLNLFPLGPDYAVISSIPFINHLSFGSAHALMRAAKLRSAQNRLGANNWDSNLNEFGYTKNIENREDQAFEDYFNKKITSTRYDLMKTNSKAKTPIQNVVLVVVESWGNFGFLKNKDFNLLGKMQNHLDQDFINFNFLSNTPGTAGSLSCILAGVPQRAISPFLTESSYLSTLLSTSPALTYKKNNFETHFLYGGNPGWRDINKYAVTQGFDFIEGEIEVKKTLSENNIAMAGMHDWGIYDEDLFKYIVIKLKEKSDQKKLYVVMTTTNHPPFELPSTYDMTKFKSEADVENYPLKNRLIDKDLAQKRFKTFRYTSDKLAEFVSSIKNSSLKKSTVLGITADHTSWLINFNNDERFSKDTVPFYIYAPENIKNELKLNKDNFQTQYGSHMDIWPTLYNLSLPKTEYESFGKNMFEKNDVSFALNNSRLIAGIHEAVFIHNGDKSSFFESANNNGLFTTTDIKNKTHEQLDMKYKSLMGSLDSYLNHSKK